MNKITLLKNMARSAFWLAENTYAGDGPILSKYHFLVGGESSAMPYRVIKGKTFSYVIPNDYELSVIPITILKENIPYAVMAFSTDEYSGIDELVAYNLY